MASAATAMALGPTAAIGRAPAKLPIMAYVVLIIVVVVILVAAVFLSIAASNLKKSKDYSEKISQHPGLKQAHAYAAWGASVGFIGAGLIVIALVVLAVEGGEFLLKSKAFVWIFAFLAVGVAIACGVLAVLSSVRLIDSGAYDPADPKMKKGYLNDTWAFLTAFLATTLVVGVTFWIAAKKPKAGAAGSPAAGPAQPVIITY